MFQFIEKEFSSIVRKAIERFAKQYNAPDEDVQLRFRLDHSGELIYSIMHKYVKKQDLTFLQVLDVKIDFRGYSLIVPPFIKKTIERFANDLNTEQTNVIIINSKNAKDIITIWLYNQGTPERSIQLKELFEEVPEIKM